MLLIISTRAEAMVFLEELEESEAKRIKGLDKEEFVYWDEETCCFIERLY